MWDAVWARSMKSAVVVHQPGHLPQLNQMNQASAPAAASYLPPALSATPSRRW